jgi:TonB-dependent receptor
VLTGVALLGSGAASAATPAPAPDSGDTVETVVVTGLRESLARSLDIKKQADVVLDSINATELGRFPDDDVADSLRHITGVTITRTTGGEGQYVDVRGLGSAYNIVTLNNRIIATDDDGRDLAFDILPADLISGADVLKSPQASAVEGSIGGTVNMRTARPFDKSGLHAAVRGEANYNDMSEFHGKKFSAFASNTWDTIGLLVGAVYSDTKTRSDALNYNSYTADYPGVWPIGSDTAVVGACCISFGSVVDQKKRTAITGTLEWKPNDSLHVTFDALYTHLDDPQVAYNQAYFPQYTTDANGDPLWSDVVVTNGLVTSFTETNFTPEIVNQTIDRKVNTSLFGLNATWQASSRLGFAFDLYHSAASRPEGGQDAFVTAGLQSADANNHDVIHWTNTQGGLPNIQVTLPGGVDFAQALATGQLTNDQWTSHYLGLSGQSIHDTVTGGTIDGTLEMSAGPLQRLRFGLAETLRDKSRADYNNDWTGGSSQYDFYVTPDGTTPHTFGSMGGNVVSTTTFPNYMHGAGGSFPRTVAVFDIAAQLAALRRLDGQPNDRVGGGTTFNFADSLPQYNAVGSYKVRENTTSAYFEADFSGSHWSGNAGVRLVHTATTASTAYNKIVSVTIADPSVPTSPADVVYSDATPTSSDGSYTYALPALNFTWRFSPELQLRLGAAETMARPSLNQLAPTRSDNALNRVYEEYFDGNSALRPIRAWQADASLEWYYQPRSAVTFAVFGKAIRDDITTQILYNQDIGVLGYFAADPPVNVPFDIYQPANGTSGTVKGVELGIQHLFDNGFGVHGQYTHSWTGLDGISPSSASLGVLYEKGPISANVNWDYTGSTLESSFTEVPGWSATSDAFSWVTAQVSYEFAKGFKVYLEGKNLTDAIARTYLNGRSDAIWSSGAAGTHSSLGQGYTAFGRAYLLGVSYRL